MNTTNSIVTFSEMPMGKIKRIHFVGIGGSGMSGIAEVIHHIGYCVTGSDLQQSKVITYLQQCGIEISIGHNASNIKDVDVVITSTAVKKDNPEVVHARKLRIPVIPRAEMLAELMRFRYGIAIAGTHGKTTTTSLVASVLAQGNLDPTFVIGGRLNSAGTHAKLGASPYLVAEADESDASFLHLQPMISIVTNLEEDHMGTYGGDYARLEDTFAEFIHQLPFYGLVILCIDDENVVKLQKKITRRFTTYGIENKSADYNAFDIEQNEFKTQFKVLKKTTKEVLHISLNMPGKHNVLNALAAIIVAKELDIKEQDIQVALENFQGIGRRFQVYGDLEIIAKPEQQAKKILMIDDYAHHPSEIKATLEAVASGWPSRRVVVIFQPHRYSRTRDLYDDFVLVLSKIEHLILLNVYPAGEESIHGADSRSLSRSIRNIGQTDPLLIQQEDELTHILAQHLQDGDILLTLGAGSIGSLAAKIAEQFS
ncbi:MAG: UDP-N-acetylmuramate--L-alanine ligase [Pseudomonadota bacterium]